MSKQFFDDRKAKAQYVRLYNELGNDSEFYRDMFVTFIKQKFDEKITSLEDLESFYITEDDVYACHEMVMLDKDAREAVALATKK